MYGYYVLEVVGDLFKEDLPAIGHGCNTTGVMGAGIAVEFKRRYPQMYKEYRRRCHGDAFPLGDVFVWPARDRIVYNLATQTRPGPAASLGAIYESVSKALDDATSRGLASLGIPRVGAGIGGLEWTDVWKTLEDASVRNYEAARAKGLPPAQLVVVTLPQVQPLPPRG